MHMRFTNILFSIVFIFSLLQASVAEAQNKKALKAYQKAKLALKADDYETCWKEIENALKYDADYFDALLFAADFKMHEENPGAAIPYYEHALAIKNLTFVKYRLATACRDHLDYAKALKYALQYQQEARIPEEKQAEFDLFIKSLEFGIEALANPVIFEPKDLGGGVNTEAMEYFPSINAKGDILVYTKRMTEGDKRDEDFYASSRVEGAWERGAKLEGFLNTHDNEGAQSLLADGSELYFAGCQRMDGYGSCDIYVSYFINGLWTKPENLGQGVNSGSWESQPSISPDGKTLYFVRGKAGYTTNTSIMISTRNADGTWGKATPIGAPINTPFAEESPFIHFDNQTLFFTSDGHAGMGRKDLFYSKKQPDGSWGTPVNLGYPINSPANEFSLIVGPDGKTGYFASDRLTGGFNLDIYSFDLPEQSRATPIAWVVGKVRNAVTQRAVTGTLDIYDLKGKTSFQQIETDDDGNFFAVMPIDRMFGVFVNKKGYLPYSANYDLAGVDTAGNFILNIALQPIKAGTKFTLHNILFDLDQYELKEESFAELDRLVAFLAENPSLKAEIQGHTDNQGTPAYNKALSLNRAKAVVNYLVDQGIASARLSFVGLGETVPIADNATESGRKQNRRTEVLLR